MAREMPPMPSTVLIGEGALAILCLDALVARGMAPALVASFDGSLADACTRLCLPHARRRDEVRAWLAEHGCDWLLSVRNPWIVPAATLATVRRLAINFHDSPLPRYAGLHATSWALLHGEREHAISWHEITPGIDEGRLLAQVPVPIADDDTALTLNAKCLEAAAAAFERVLEAIATESVTLTPQVGPRSYFGGTDRPAAQCTIDWEHPARAIVDLVRALAFGHAPNPLGLPKLWLGERAVVVLAATATATPSTAAPGTVLACEGGSVRVATSTTDVVLSRLAGLDGQPLTTADAQALLEPLVSRALPRLDASARDTLCTLDRSAARSEREWIRRLVEGVVPAGHPYVPAETWGPLRAVALPRLGAALHDVAPAQRSARARAVVTAYLARLHDGEALDVGMVRPEVESASAVVLAPIVPLRMPSRALSFAAFEAAVVLAWDQVQGMGTLALDLGPRTPALRGRPLLPTRWPVAVVEAALDDALATRLAGHVALLVGIHPNDGHVQLLAAAGLPVAHLEALDAQLAVLARAAAEDPTQLVSALPLLDAAERTRMLVEWNATQQPIPDACVHALIEQQAQRTPQAPAVRFGDERLTYAELVARAGQVAQALHARGVRPGQLVAIAVRRSVELVVGVLGILQAGAAYVPIDGGVPRERVALMLQRSRPHLLVTDASTHAALAPLVETTLCLQEDAAFIAAQPAVAPAAAVSPDDLAYVIFTSGSTGEPKGVEIRHRSLVNHGLAVQHHYELGAGDRMLCSASIGFDVHAEQIYPPLLHGAEVVVRPDDLFESFQGFDTFLRERAITALALPTAFWHEWVRFLQARDLPVPPALRVLGVGTEKALGEALAAWRERGGHGVRFLQGYGPTEATITCTMYRHDGGDVDPSRPLPIGRPLANTEIYVLDHAGEPVPVGMPGELCVGGVGLARGYLGRPDLTAERFVPHPFRTGGQARIYKTGDIVRWEPDGQLVYVGRSDFQVKIRGFRVELGEIEAVLRSHPHVDDGVVVLREDAGEPKRLVAYLRLRDGAAALDTGELEACCRARLPEYMVPAAFVVMPAFPLTHNSKIDRAALPRPAAAASRPSRAVHDELEQRLAQAFAEVLGLPAVGPSDGFFDLGGDSLRAMIMLERLEAALSRPIPLGQLFRTSSVETLAAYLRAGEPEGGDEQPAVVRLKPGEGTPLFLAMGVHMYRELVQALSVPNPVYAVVQPVESALVRHGEPLPSVQELARRNVELLLRHTPQGPYAIGGFSFGGFVAYEMAQRLRAQGHAVTVLALFDCILTRGRTPGLRTAARVYGRALLGGELLPRVARRLRRAIAARLEPTAASPTAASPAAATAVPSEAERLRTFRDTAYTRAISDYDRVIQPYHGTVALYRATAFRRPVMPYHGFDELVTGRMATFDVASDHDGLLRAGNAARVARHLETLLAPHR